MKIIDLKKQLKSMEQNELVTLVCTLYKASKQAQSIIDVELCSEAVEEQLVAAHKKKIRIAFFGSRLSLKSAKTVISDFKKIAKNKENIAELMLYYVECGVEFTSTYGDIDEAFYYSIESMFSDFVSVLNNLDSNAYYERNADRIKEMCLSTDCVGWGFQEEMMSIYYEIQWLKSEE